MTALPVNEPVSQPVILIDDDDAVRIALSRLFESAGLVYRAFQTGTEFLEHYTPDLTGCLVLDIRMPGISGLELQRELIRRGSLLPIIFMTGHGDLPMAVNAMRLGALHFLRKPIDSKELIDTVEQAFQVHTRARQRWCAKHDAAELIARLTDREQQVFQCVSNGLVNKAIAEELAISTRTVEVHRSKVMHKLGVSSIAELLRMKLNADADL